MGKAHDEGISETRTKDEAASVVRVALTFQQGWGVPIIIAWLSKAMRKVLVAYEVKG